MAITTDRGQNAIDGRKGHKDKLPAWRLKVCGAAGFAFCALSTPAVLAQQLLTSTPLPDVDKLPEAQELPILYPLTQKELEQLRKETMPEVIRSIGEIAPAAGARAQDVPPPPPPPPVMPLPQQDEGLPLPDLPAFEGARQQENVPALPGAPSEEEFLRELNTDDVDGDKAQVPEVPPPPAPQAPSALPVDPDVTPETTIIEREETQAVPQQTTPSIPATIDEVPALPVPSPTIDPEELLTTQKENGMNIQVDNPLEAIQEDLRTDAEKREQEIEALFEELLGQEEAQRAKEKEQQFFIDFKLLGEDETKESEATSTSEQRQRRKRGIQEERLLVEEQEQETEEVAPQEASIKPAIRPQERSRTFNYKTQEPSPLIHKKTYSRENEHLPPVAFRQDYINYLYVAAYRGNINGIRALLERGVKPDAVADKGDTALMAAAFTGQLDAVRLLLLRGANPNLQNRDGNTALHMAAFSGNPDVIRALMHMGARNSITNQAGLTPADIAMQNNNPEAASLLRGTLEKDVAGVPPRRVPQMPDAQQAAPTIPAPQTAPGQTAPVPAPQKPGITPDALDREVPQMQPYWTMSPEQQAIWKGRLEDWKAADRQFENLSFEDKVEYNYRRKVLEQVFPNHFRADDPVDQLLLDSYMKRWYDFDRQLRLSRMTDPSGRAPQVSDFFGSGLNFTPAPLDLSNEALFGVPSPSDKPMSRIPRAVPDSLRYSDIQGGVQPITQEGRDRLREILENWRVIDERFENMTLDQRIRANQQRRKLLDMLVYDSGRGTYAAYFAELPSQVIQGFIRAMKKWDDFEDWLRENRTEMAKQFPMWGSVPEEAIAYMEGTRVPKVVFDEDGARRTSDPSAAESVQIDYPSHDRMKYRLMQSVRHFKDRIR